MNSEEEIKSRISKLSGNPPEYLSIRKLGVSKHGKQCCERFEVTFSAEKKDDFDVENASQQLQEGISEDKDIEIEDAPAKSAGSRLHSLFHLVF